jgi:hypothetical protein
MAAKAAAEMAEMAVKIEDGVLSKAHVIRVPRFEGKHIVYMALCFAGAVSALVLFRQDLNLTLVRFQDEPLGTVTRKQNIAQRRFEDRILWDRLRRQSFVYSGDYIRTAELSSAVLSLSGGGLVELAEHTLIQLEKSGEDLVLDLAGGALEADTGGGGLTVRASGLSLRADPGSVLNAASGEGGFTAGLASGSAVVTGPGETRALRQGDTVGRVRRAVVLHPRPGAVFLNPSGGPLDVDFVWDRGPAGQALRLDIAEDRAFTAPFFSRESAAGGLSAALENGRYYWRVYPPGQVEDGVSGRLSVIRAAPPELISPAPEEEFAFRTLRPGIRFLWTSREGADSYLLEISPNPDMTNPRYQGFVQDSGGEVSSIVHSGFESGTWYWRVRPEYPRNSEGSPQASRTGSFRVRRAESLTTPLPQLPPERGSFYLEDQKERLWFSWKQEEDAASYTFLLSRREDLQDPFIREQVRDNYYVYDVTSGVLDPGEYYWGVYQTSSEGGDSLPSAARRVVIVAGPPPETLPPETSPRVEIPPQAGPDPAARETRPAEASPPGETAPPAARPDPAPRPLPPLPAPGNLRPPSGYALTEDLILRDRQIAFSWDAVPGASSYVFTLYQTENGGRREILRRAPSENRFVLTDLAVLDTGSFIWRVEPRSRAAEQRGEAAESGFTVSIEETQASRGMESGVMFGTE